MSTRLQNTIITVSSPPAEWPKSAVATVTSQQMQTIKPTATINIQKKALKKMFLSVEIVKEMSEYPEYDDHNSTLDPKNAIPTISQKSANSGNEARRNN